MNDVDLGDLLTENRIRIRQKASSKKKALDLLSEVLFDDLLLNCDCEGFTHSNLLDAFIAREKIGSTALEHGIAVPHCRVDNCTAPMIAVISLAEAIDFGSASNDDDVDLLCGLIVPKAECQQHLDILAALVKVLGVEDNRENIRAATSSQQVLEIMTGTHS